MSIFFKFGCIEKCNVSFHCFADDAQISMPSEVKSEGLIYLICLTVLVFILTMSLNLISSSCLQRTIVKIKTYLPPEDSERLRHAFVTFRLDYCNSVVHPEPAAASKCDCTPLSRHKKEGLYYPCSTLLPLASCLLQDRFRI